MPRMIKIGEKYINADRLYSIEPLPGTKTVRIAHEAAPQHVEYNDIDFSGSPEEDRAQQWARGLVMVIDPTYISFNGVGPEQHEARDRQEPAAAEGQEEGGHSWV